MRTTVRLDDDLLGRAKRLATRTGRTLAAVVEDALRAALARAGERPRGRERISLPTFGRGGTLRGIDLDDSAELLAVMDREVDPD